MHQKMVDLLRQFSRYTSQGCSRSQFVHLHKRYTWRFMLTLLFIVQVLKQSAVAYLNGSDYASQVDDCDDCTFIQL
jgi:hypothetical protein